MDRYLKNESSLEKIFEYSILIPGLIAMGLSYYNNLAYGPPIFQENPQTEQVYAKSD